MSNSFPKTRNIMYYARVENKITKMLNPKKHKTLTAVVMTIIGLSLVMAYVPLLFVKPNVDYGYPSTPPKTLETPVTPQVTTTPALEETQ